MRPPSRIELAVLAAVLTLPAVPAAAQTSPESSAVVREFFVRYTAGDASGASRLWVAGAPAETFVRRSARRLERRCLRLEALSVRVTDDPSVVETVETFSVRSRHPGSREWIETSASRFELQRDATQWRIAAWESREKKLIEQLAAAGDAAEHTHFLDASQELRTTTLVRLLVLRVMDLINQHRFDRAAALNDMAQSIAEELGDPVAMAATISARSVIVRATPPGDPVRSYDLGREAVAIADIGGDPDILARALLRLARSIEMIQTIPDLASLRRAHVLTAELEDPSIAALVATHLSRSYELSGHMREAFRYAELASRFAEESGDPASRISASLMFGAAYLWIGDHHLAERHYRRAARLANEYGFPGITAHAVAATSVTAGGTGRSDEALRILNEALQITTDPEGRALLLSNRCAVHRSMGHVAEARRDLHELNAIDAPNVTSQQTIELLKGAIARTAGEYETALQHLAAARGPNAAGDRMARLMTAETLLCSGRIPEARELLEDLIPVGDVSWLVEPERLLFRGFDHDTYANLVLLFAEQGDLPSALEVAVQSQATAQRQAVTRGGMNAVQLPEKDRRREQALNERIRLLNRMLFVGTPSTAEAAVLREQLEEAQADLLDDRQRRFVSQTPPDSVPPALPRRSFELHLQDLPSRLDDTAIVLYMVHAQQTLVFAVEPKQQGHRRLTMRTISIREGDLKERITRLATIIDQRNLRAPELTAEMYELLVAPIAAALGSAKALCIVPDSSLWHVPFHALGPRNGSVLLEHMPVFYAPSIAVLSAAESRRNRRGDRDERVLLAFANPRVTSETASLYRTVLPDAPIGAIPETESEVRAIARIYGPQRSRIYIGDDARESVFKHEAPYHRVLHIATHGLAHHYAPMFSSLLLTSSENETEDGVLEAREIATLDLDVDLAVLSACETGKAEDTTGDGVIGLSWALLAAGCPTTVVSQWKAQSAATAKLMLEFHRHVNSGASNAEALQRAQLSLRRQSRYRHAFYWAPFIVVGAP